VQSRFRNSAALLVTNPAEHSTGSNECPFATTICDRFQSVDFTVLRTPERALRNHSVGAERSIDFARITDGLTTEVPAGRRSQRYGRFRIVDPSNVITVIVNLRHQKREGNQLALEQPAGSCDAVRIRNAGKHRELHVLHANECVILKTRVLAGRRWRAVCRPLIERAERRACDVGPHRIEHPPVLLVRVEAVVQELT
jgi:hypothetical protein